MSVATICARREIGPPPHRRRSWVIRVNGLIYSKRQQFVKAHPGFSELKNGECILGDPLAEDVDLKELLENKLLPINLVTILLKTLAEAGYRVTASTSGAASDEELWFIWTLGV